MSARSEIAGRLRLFADKLGGSAKLRELLSVSPQQMSNLLSGRSAVGGRMQDRLREIGCDLTWLITGQTKEHLDKAADSMFIRKARELMPKEFAMIDRLKERGFDTEEKLLRLLDAHRSILLAAEGMEPYNKKRKRKS